MFLNFLLDVILLTILLGGAYCGYQSGFFRMAAKPTRLVLSILLSFSLCRCLGNFLVMPAINARLGDEIRAFALPAVRALSTLIAFVLLLLLSRIVLSFAISIASRFFDSGIIGRINRSLGVILAGGIALVLAICFASIADYLFSLEAAENSDIVKEFSGGIIYRLLLMISPIGL